MGQSLRSEYAISWSRKFPSFMELEGLLTYSQDPVQVLVLSYMKAVCILTSYLTKPHFHVKFILSTPRSPKFSLPLKFFV
jgi:hypothetical protein